MKLTNLFNLIFRKQVVYRPAKHIFIRGNICSEISIKSFLTKTCFQTEATLPITCKTISSVLQFTIHLMALLKMYAV